MQGYQIQQAASGSVPIASVISEPSYLLYSLRNVSYATLKMYIWNWFQNDAEDVRKCFTARDNIVCSDTDMNERHTW